MKRKTLKINQNTLFVYKSLKSSNVKLWETEPTTMTVTTLTHTTGIFAK